MLPVYTFIEVTQRIAVCFILGIDEKVGAVWKLTFVDRLEGYRGGESRIAIGFIRSSLEIRTPHWS